MKNRMMQIAVVVGVTAAALSVQAGKLPEFMNAQQLTAWRAQHAPSVALSQAPGEPVQFFTGKPYDAASGTYLFKYRAYSPTLARWTSADPSGFPDGANNFAYSPVPTYGFDLDGLMNVIRHRIDTVQLGTTWSQTGLIGASIITGLTAVLAGPALAATTTWTVLEGMIVAGTVTAAGTATSMTLYNILSLQPENVSFPPMYLYGNVPDYDTHVTVSAVPTITYGPLAGQYQGPYNSFHVWQLQWSDYAYSYSE